MRALAEFIMRGRWQASLVALLGNLVPLLSPAAVGLVVLRHRLRDALLVMLWAALPLLLAPFMTETNGLLGMVSVCGLAVVVIAGEVLKVTQSWPITLLAVLLVSTGLVLLSGILMSVDVDLLIGEVHAAMAGLANVGEGPSTSPFYLLMAVTALGAGLSQITATYSLGFLAWLTTMNALGGLFLSRWWQALLYNPGAFQKEFHNLRFDVPIALFIMTALVILYMSPSEYMPWASMFGAPLLLSGLGFAHYAVKLFGLGSMWLVMLYIALIIYGPLSIVLVATGFLDSLFNFRTRLVASRK